MQRLFPAPLEVGPIQNDEGSHRPGPMALDDKPRDQSSKRMHIDEDKRMQWVSANVIEGMKFS